MFNPGSNGVVGSSGSLNVSWFDETDTLSLVGDPNITVVVVPEASDTGTTLPLLFEELDQCRVDRPDRGARCDRSARGQAIDSLASSGRSFVDQRLVRDEPGVEPEVDGLCGRVDRHGERADRGRVADANAVDGGGGRVFAAWAATRGPGLRPRLSPAAAPSRGQPHQSRVGGVLDHVIGRAVSQVRRRPCPAPLVDQWRAAGEVPAQSA